MEAGGRSQIKEQEEEKKKSRKISKSNFFCNSTHCLPRLGKPLRTTPLSTLWGRGIMEEGKGVMQTDKVFGHAFPLAVY
jgi:hypothetical protein